MYSGADQAFRYTGFVAFRNIIAHDRDSLFQDFECERSADSDLYGRIFTSIQRKYRGEFIGAGLSKKDRALLSWNHFENEFEQFSLKSLQPSDGVDLHADLHQRAQVSRHQRNGIFD